MSPEGRSGRSINAASESRSAVSDSCKSPLQACRWSEEPELVTKEENLDTVEEEPEIERNMGGSRWDRFLPEKSILNSSRQAFVSVCFFFGSGSSI